MEETIVSFLRDGDVKDTATVSNRNKFVGRRVLKTLSCGGRNEPDRT